mmetsp:Transcript_7396/g.18371  ORF Transcript_7396/g.18371 Transcript_7396/m.18371 type:complete len:378 (-) Transcript_7396:337-1470(-)
MEPDFGFGRLGYDVDMCGFDELGLEMLIPEEPDLMQAAANCMVIDAPQVGRTVTTQQFSGCSHGSGARGMPSHGGLDGSADDALQLQRAVMMHPLYPKLLDAICACRKVGVGSQAELSVLDASCVRAKAEAASAVAAARSAGGLPAEVSDPDLHAYLAAYIAAAEAHRGELACVYAEMEGAGRELEGEVTRLLTSPHAYTDGQAGSGRNPGATAAPSRASPTPTATITTGSLSGVSAGSLGGGGAKSGGCGGGADGGGGTAATVGALLKRRYNERISELTEEFSRKRSKGKLPDDATAHLRAWWREHYAWPYPGDDVKAVLARQSNLTATQVNNWFINQRKRHWHKLFPGGHPETPEEALASLRTTGNLRAARDLVL